MRAISGWSDKNRPLPNISKTKEMVVDFQRSKLQQVNIRGEDTEVVKTQKYLCLHFDSKLDWSANMDVLNQKGVEQAPLLEAAEVV